MEEKNASRERSVSKKNKQDGDQEKIQGSCYRMCPKDEENLRIKEKMVHVLEKCGTDLKLVKSFTRSAADCNMAVPDNLRPFTILQATVTYLIFDVTKRYDVPTPVMYDFVNDRLKAVRQDMTIQRLSYKECALLLEPMIRFYIYYGYRLHGRPLKDYDPVLNKKYLLDCQKWFLNCCDNTIDLKHADFMTPSELSDLMVELNLGPGSGVLACDQILMESLYILCNLGDNNPMWRFANLPLDIRRKPKICLAYQLAFDYTRGNYVKVAKLFPMLCPLAHCAVSLFLPEMQRNGIRAIARAYTKRDPVPSSAIRRWFAFPSEAEALDACRHYGMTVENSCVRFAQDFKAGAQMHESNIHFLNENVDLSVPHVFTYTI